MPVADAEVIPAHRWVLKLMRRVAALPDGRYVIVVSKQADDSVDWSVLPVGKVEHG